MLRDWIVLVLCDWVVTKLKVRWLGFDAGFGPGSYAENVASFAIDEWNKRKAA